MWRGINGVFFCSVGSGYFIEKEGRFHTGICWGERNPPKSQKTSGLRTQQVMFNLITKLEDLMHSLKLPMKIGPSQQEIGIPTIHFQVGDQTAGLMTRWLLSLRESSRKKHQKYSNLGFWASRKSLNQMGFVSGDVLLSTMIITILRSNSEVFVQKELQKTRKMFWPCPDALHFLIVFCMQIWCTLRLVIFVWRLALLPC